MGQTVSDLVFQAISLRIFSAKIFVTRAIGCNGDIASQVMYTFVFGVCSQIGYSSQELEYDFIANIFAVPAERCRRRTANIDPKFVTYDLFDQWFSMFGLQSCQNRVRFRIVL